MLPNLGFYPNVGSTPSSVKGPSTNAKPGSALGRYMYAEATNFETNRNSWIVSTPFYSKAGAACSTSVCSVSFKYHQYGNGFYIGAGASIVVAEMVKGDATTQLLMNIGAGGSSNSWWSATVDIPPVNGPLRIRWRVQRGSSWSAEFAVDDITFSAGCVTGT